MNLFVNKAIDIFGAMKNIPIKENSTAFPSENKRVKLINQSFPFNLLSRCFRLSLATKI